MTRLNIKLALLGCCFLVFGCTRSSADEPRPQPTPAATNTEPPEAVTESEVPDDPAPCSHVPGICVIALQPLGDVPIEQITEVERALAETYDVSTVVLEQTDLPDTAWYEPRRRWRAERLLDYLEPLLPDGADRIIGMTTQDISTTKGEHEDWGILGLADVGGTASVISYFRCRRRVGEVPAIVRLGRVAIHELGHSLGLYHCPTFACYMEDAGGRVDTIDRETSLCIICRRRIGWVE